MKLALELICEAAAGVRTTANIFKIFSRYVDTPTPSRSSISHWAAIVGLYIYTFPIEQADDWIWMIDLSIPLGSKKLCLILGIRLSSIKPGNFNVGYHDMTILRMEALDCVNGEVILQQLNKVKLKIGAACRYVLLDGGSDVNKGVKNFCEENNGVVSLQDISHKIANIMKGILKEDPTWNEFIKYVDASKRHICQSSIGFLSPPKQRTKARFLGLSRVTKWACKVLCADGMGDLEIEDLIKCNLYLGGLDNFSEEIFQWDMAFEVSEKIQKEIKIKGLTRGVNGGKSTSQKLEEMLSEDELLTEYVRKIAATIIAFVREEEKKLKEGDVVMGSTDILESLNGIWKTLSPEDALCGCTKSTLILPVFTRKLSDELIKAAMEKVSWDDVTDWCEINLGSSMFSKRLVSFT